MKHTKALSLLTACLLLTSSCESEPETRTTADAPMMTATSVTIESVDAQAGLSAKMPGQTDFAPLRESQPFPAGTELQTPPTARATIEVSGNRVTLNHSTTIELHAERLVLKSGQVVVEHDGAQSLTVSTPTGDAVANAGAGATKFAAVAGEGESTVTVTRGILEVVHGKQGFEARAGHELVLPAEGSPRLTIASDLARRFDWSELTRPDQALEAVPRGLGKLVGKTPGGEREHKLDLVRHAVDAQIQGNVAYTEVHETFENLTSQTLEGVYRFPLPANAQVSRLALKVGNKWMEGEFLETARAEQIWRDVITPRRDPAMLKWKEGNTFELRIFPINPREKREVKIGYIQRLDPAPGGYHYAYPMPVDTTGLIPVDNFEFNATLHGHQPTEALEVTGYPATVEHSATQKDEPVTTVSWSAASFVARGDLGVRFARNKPTGLEAFSYVEKDDQGYAVFALRPDLPVREEVRPRDFVVALDRSANRLGIAMDVQQRLVTRMIAEMDPLDRVVVIACNHECVPVGSPEFQPARAGTAQEVEAALVELKATGATYPVEAVRVAGELFRRRSSSDREAHLVWFTDGVASAGELRPGPLGEAAGKVLAPHRARTTLVDVGGDRDDANLEALARGANGRIIAVDPNLSATGQALAILSEHYRSLLVAPQIVVPPGVHVDSLLPLAVADGDEIVFTARFDGAPSGKVTLRGAIDGQPYEQAYDFALDRQRRRGNAFVPREWASQRIRTLELGGLDAGDPKKEIVRLSTRFGVLSRYTTLLALESRDMMAEFDVRARDRTEFRGDELAEAAEDAEPAFDADFGSTAAPRPKKARSRRQKKSKPRSESAVIDLMPSDDGASRGSTKTLQKQAEPQRGWGIDSAMGDVRKPASSRGPRRTRRRHVPTVRSRDADATTAWERSNVDRKLAAHEKDPTNRSKWMSLIRAQIRAGQLSAARRTTMKWLEINAMDPEAVVQLAQIEAREGDLDAFFELLLSAADAAPRGKWLLERLQHAAEADQRDALACAYEVSLEAVARRAPKVPRDILACPMTTVTGAWFGGAAPNPVAAETAKQPHGKVVVSLTSDNGSDWDLAFIEPNGRLLWWGSARQNLKTAGVRGGSTEYLALPALRRGTYSVIAIPAGGTQLGESLLTVTVKGSGGKRTFTASASKPIEIAEFELK